MLLAIVSGMLCKIFAQMCLDFCFAPGECAFGDPQDPGDFRILKSEQIQLTDPAAIRDGCLHGIQQFVARYLVLRIGETVDIRRTVADQPGIVNIRWLINIIPAAVAIALTSCTLALIGAALLGVATPIMNLIGCVIDLAV